MTHEELRQLRFAVTDGVWDKLKEEKSALDFISDDFWDWFDEAVEKPLMRLICDVEGHSPTRDMCGKPEHDYCAICNISMPGAALICSCSRFSDTGGVRIADLACPIHGVEGTAGRWVLE